MPLVSVVIPTLHRPKLVLRAIHSVLNQTYREIELIVVVDGPDKATVAAVRSIEGPRLRLIVNPLIVAGARNTGADRATGDWIAFLDDDDEWLPKKNRRAASSRWICSGATCRTTPSARPPGWNCRRKRGRR